ncbi:MAG: alpha/beta hydrolase [Cyclobacteriaceae bacterium]
MIKHQYLRIHFIAIVCYFFLSGLSLAQDQQGNIVQYFGKEKVEDVNEGDVVHLFTEGLMLRQSRSFFSPDAIPTDPVFARILSEGQTNIREGKEEAATKDGEKWERIEVGDKNDFNDRNLRSGYLYLEYNSPEESIVLFEASGHTNILINGLPREGDHYDFGWNLIPVKLKKGKNEFVLAGGRFPKMRARLLKANNPIQFTRRDLTVPDLLAEENEPLWAAIRVMNTTEDWFEGGSISCQVGQEELDFDIPGISPMTVRKVPFTVPTDPRLTEEDQVKSIVKLKDKKGKVLHTDSINLKIKSKFKHHKNTFISNIDGSVQYYSVAPSLDQESDNQAMFLSVHGASVEAVNQANAYKQKDWGHLVAPTNRRPFGFAWEDWGRLDALEVLDHSEKLFGTDPQHTYLTGHSMGGHGTWYLGATYPDRFAAIAPCAGYPDLLEYRQSFVRRMMDRPEEDFARFGMSKSEFLEKAEGKSYESEVDAKMDEMIRRAGNPSRTLKLKRNYLHHGVYVLHGEKDTVVPTFLARDMRETLGKFHPDFAYYEYPDGTHWYGNHSVDWPPIFNFFQERSIKPTEEIKKVEFSTASPGVSAGSHFVKILQQEKPFEVSTFEFERAKEGAHSIKTENAQCLEIDLDKMSVNSDTIVVDEQEILLSDGNGSLYLKKEGATWKLASAPAKAEKGPHRNGGFKDAFRNKVVLVYASKGSKEENEWYYNRAQFDAEKFWYRANGNVEIVKDTRFSLSKYPDRNIILYGNKDNNAAWNTLLKNCPVQFSDDKLKVGNRIFAGEQWGGYFVYPRHDSEVASIGVVTATGAGGMKGAYANDYLVNGTTFPDVIIFDDTMMKNGVPGVKCTGFFGNDWSVEQGDFQWR